MLSSGTIQSKWPERKNKANEEEEEEDDDVDVDKLKFCTQILIHKISFDVPIHLSAAPKHAIAQSERKREQNILLSVCASDCKIQWSSAV